MPYAVEMAEEIPAELSSSDFHVGRHADRVPWILFDGLLVGSKKVAMTPRFRRKTKEIVSCILLMGAKARHEKNASDEATGQPHAPPSSDLL